MADKNQITIAIAGDICPVKRAKNPLSEGNLSFIDATILQHFQDADYSIANLECPLTNSNESIEKTGPTLKSTPETIVGIKKIGINAVNLSNNHIMDKGAQGLKDTIELLNKNSIDYWGAGPNLEAASKPHIITLKGKKIAFVGVAASEFSIATDSNYGANPIDAFKLIPQILKLKQEVDYIIVLAHIGIYSYALPSPEIRKFCRELSELGVQAVICQHSHTIGAFEHTPTGFISYGQGNFIFDNYTKSDIWNRGYIIKLNLSENGIKGEAIYYKQFYNTSLLEVIPTQNIEAYQASINAKLTNEIEFKNEWNKYLKKNTNSYIANLITTSVFIRKILKKLPLYKFIGKKHSLVLQNLLRTEEHREILIDIFKKIR